jgi:hypothetical protein
LILALYDFPDGVETMDVTCVVYDVARNEAFFGARRVDGHAIVWEVSEYADPSARLVAGLDLIRGDYLLRCDRVDFPPGGVAYLHTHPGPGIRCLLHGSIRIESEGDSRVFGPFDAWFERGPDPVLATASETEETAFVRVLVLPPRWAGQRTIRYENPEDEDKPKTQSATVFLEEPIEL